MSDRKTRKPSTKSVRAAGRRYTSAQKAKILKLAERHGVEKAAQDSGASIWSIYRWRQAATFRRPAVPRRIGIDPAVNLTETGIRSRMRLLSRNLGDGFSDGQRRSFLCMGGPMDARSDEPV